MYEDFLIFAYCDATFFDESKALKCFYKGGNRLLLYRASHRTELKDHKSNYH